MFTLKITTHFAAAHQLRMVGEKCENLHGHNWHIEVCVAGDKLNAAGVLMDFGDLKRDVAGIIKTLDHKFLNELPAFGNPSQPSSENIAVYIAEALDPLLADSPVRVNHVTAWESENARARYFPPQNS